ncbi:hypothetical protein VPH35_020872 [Triticum aestivum]
MSSVSWACLPCRRGGGGGGVRRRLRGEAPGYVSVYGGARRGEEAAVAAADAACADDMEAYAGGDVVRAASADAAEAATRHGTKAWRHGTTAWRRRRPWHGCRERRPRETRRGEPRRARRGGHGRAAGTAVTGVSMQGRVCGGGDRPSVRQVRSASWVTVVATTST